MAETMAFDGYSRISNGGKRSLRQLTKKRYIGIRHICQMMEKNDMKEILNNWMLEILMSTVFIVAIIADSCS